eukprot:4648558-Ditylum_brightwellii.AAC.1
MNLPVLCSITSISTAIGHDECEQACEAARCCTAPGEASCFLEKEALCGTVSFIIEIRSLSFQADDES